MQKYKKRKKIKSLNALSKQEFAYIRGKVYHNGWFMRMQAKYLEDLIKLGFVFKAKKLKNI